MRKTRLPAIPPCEECTTRSSSMFCNLGLSNLQLLSSEKTSNLYKKGQTIFNEDRLPHGLYCIYSGKVKIHKSGDDGQEQIVRFAKPGHIIGYRALLTGENYSASATAMENSSICYFPKHAFMELLKSDHEFSLLTMKKLANDLGNVEHMLTSMAHKYVEERMAEALILLIQCYGFAEDNTTLNAELSRREFASITGTTTETAIRILSEFKNREIIQLNGKQIEILDIEKLYKVANLQKT